VGRQERGAVKGGGAGRQFMARRKVNSIFRCRPNESFDSESEIYLPDDWFGGLSDLYYIYSAQNARAYINFCP